MIRVLEVSYCFGYGGIRTCIQNYITYINKDEFQIDLFIYGASESPFRQSMEDIGCHMYFDPINYIAQKKIREFVNVLTDFIKKGQYDVVHAHCNLISAWVVLAAKRAGVKVRITHSHSTSHLGNSIVQKVWCYLRRFIINRFATTKMACGQLAGETMYGDNAKFTILQNGIDIEKFKFRNDDNVTQLRNNLNIPEKSKVYMNITRFDKQKNLPFVIRVFHEIYNIDPTAFFIIGGTESLIESNRSQIDQYVIDHKLSDRIKVVGARMDMTDMYQLADCWVFPSIFEGLPFIPIELQAASVPVLASDVITKEIDLGLGLIKFLSLDSSYSEWAKVAVETEKKQIDQNKIEEAFNKYNFNIKQNVKMLESIYRGDLK